MRVGMGGRGGGLMGGGFVDLRSCGLQFLPEWGERN